MYKKSLFKNYYDVVIIPPVNVRNIAIRLSRRIADQFDGEFKLGHLRFVPHISLYHIALKPNCLPEFRDALKKIMEEVSLGSLRITAIKQIKEKSVWIEISRPKWLVNLHRLILKQTFKFQDSDFPAWKVWKGYNSSACKKNIKVYGSPYVGQLFQPHITLTVLKQEISDLKKIKIKKEGFQVKSVSAYQLGLHHTCHRKMFTVLLKKRK